MNRRILLLTDSLALPRDKPEVCTYADVYPSLLKKENEVHQISIGGATSSVLLKQIHYHKTFNPDVVIVQVGIVDCAPRFMSQKELDFTSALGLLGKSIRGTLNKKWVRKVRNISYVNKEDFGMNIDKIKNSFSCPVIFIGIVPATDTYEQILPGVSAKIQIYNNAIKSKAHYLVDTSIICEQGGLMSDHHHLNIKGHTILYQQIKEQLSKL